MENILRKLELRYGQNFPSSVRHADLTTVSSMLTRGSCRQFQPRAVEPDIIEILCAAALASPTKSDLQQRDIIVMKDPEVKQTLFELVSGEGWVSQAPEIVVFCGNNRRQRMTHALRGHEFVNDHLDAFFNAAVDAGIALGAFVTAAEAMGLGCCPVSAVRNKAEEVSALLNLPDHVFPVSAVAFGYPEADKPNVSLRLPLSVTVHNDRYCEDGLEQVIESYDRRREAEQPYAKQRAADVFGTSDAYGWSEDKTRQYALPERAGFGAFIRGKGFKLF